jgi:hypothetical protein
MEVDMKQQQAERDRKVEEEERGVGKGSKVMAACRWSLATTQQRSHWVKRQSRMLAPKSHEGENLAMEHLKQIRPHTTETGGTG